MTTTVMLLPGARVVDYVGRPNLTALKAAGAVGVVRYLNASKTMPGKQLTRPECEALWEAGFAVMSAFELNGTRALGGKALGALDGKQAVQLAYALGVPPEVPIACAADFDVTLATVGVVTDYVQAFVENCVPYLGGVYGDLDIIEAVAGFSHFNWRAGGWKYGANGKPRPNTKNVHMEQFPQTQIGGVAVDWNTVWRPTPFWLPKSDPITPPPPKPPVVVYQEDPAMYVLDSDTKGSCLVTLFQVNGQRRYNCQGFNTVDERAGWAAGLNVVHKADADYLAFTAGSTPLPGVA